MNRVLPFVSILALLAPFAAAESPQARQRVSLSIREVAALEVGGDVELTLDPSTAGVATLTAADGSAHLRYTAVTGSEPLEIRAGITAGATPRGTTLRLLADGFGRNEGESAGELIVGPRPSLLVAGISSCATGAGASDGPTLRYVWSVDDPALLESGLERTLTVSFWLGDTRDDHRVVLRVVEPD